MARLASGEPNIVDKTSLPAARPSRPKAVSGSSYIACRSGCRPMTLKRPPRPSGVAVDCLRPMDMAGRSAATAASVCRDVSPNSRPSTAMASPRCASARISYRLAISLFLLGYPMMAILESDCASTTQSLHGSGSSAKLNPGPRAMTQRRSSWEVIVMWRNSLSATRFDSSPLRTCDYTSPRSRREPERCCPCRTGRRAHRSRMKSASKVQTHEGGSGWRGQARPKLSRGSRRAS